MLIVLFDTSENLLINNVTVVSIVIMTLLRLSMLWNVALSLKDIPKKILDSVLSICTEHPSTKLNSQSAIILTQRLCQIDVVDIVWILYVTFDESSKEF